MNRLETVLLTHVSIAISIGCFCTQVKSEVVGQTRRTLAQREDCVVIQSVGSTSPAQKASADAVVVREDETVVVRVGPCFEAYAYLFPVTRQSGEPWKVQPGISLQAGGSHLIRLPVRFGNQGASLSLWDFGVILHTSQLPIGPVPEELFTNSAAIAMSEILRVRRDTSSALVAITYIDNQAIYDSTDMPWVQDEAGIRTSGREVPPNAWICVAIRGARPLDSNYWVQDSCLRESGVINAYFGEVNLHEFYRFDVVSFVALSKFVPPRGVPISALQWDRYQTNFLALSKPARVVKAGRYFSIEQIDEAAVISGRSLGTSEQIDIRGRLDRPLGAKEKIWLIGIPFDGGEPYVLTPVVGGSDSDWQAVGVRLRKTGARGVEIVAVISEDDPSGVEKDKLRYWINERRRTVNTARVHIVGTGR